MELLAHAGPHIEGGAALAAIAIAAMIIPLVVLGFIGRAFWRAAKREEEERARRDAGRASAPRG